MDAPTQIAPDDARHDYIARVYKMTHAELFAELMRVHTEANRLVEQAVKDEREWCAYLCSATAPGRDAEAIEEAIRARGQS